MRLPLQVQTKIPEVVILEQSINFGKLTTLGTPGQIPITLQNQSTIQASLLFDLRENEKYPGVECLNIEYIDPTNTG